MIELSILLKASCDARAGPRRGPCSSVRAQASVRHLWLAATLATLAVAPGRWRCRRPAVTIAVPAKSRGRSASRGMASARVLPPEGGSYGAEEHWKPLRVACASAFRRKTSGATPASAGFSWAAVLQARLGRGRRWRFVASLIVSLVARPPHSPRRRSAPGRPATGADAGGRGRHPADGRGPRARSDVRRRFTCGLWRPAIVLPCDARDWDEADIRRAIVHELEHVRRDDWAVQLAARVVCAGLLVPSARVDGVARAVPRSGARVRRRRREGGGSDRLRRSARAAGAAAVERPAARDARHGESQRPVDAGDGAARRPPAARPRRCARGGDGGARRGARARGHRAGARGGRRCRRPQSHRRRRRLRRKRRLRRRHAPREQVGCAARAEDADASGPLDRAIYEAAEEGDIESIDKLLQAGANVNAAVDGDGSPLIAAARAGELAAVKHLLDRGADPNMPVLRRRRAAAWRPPGRARLAVVSLLARAPARTSSWWCRATRTP